MLGGLVVLIVIIIFTLLSKPNTFLSINNALGIMRSMSTIAIVALGLTLVIVVGEIDLSFGYMYGLASILIGVAWVVWGWPIWFAIPLFPMFVIFFISTLAETNRSPFDLPEGESEIVGGFFVEYSAMTFALFFLGEYANMILMSAMTSILFLGGWLSPLPFAPFTWVPGPIWFILKICLCLFGFLWVRATFPRFRYDQLMRLGWKVFLPLSLGWLILTAGVLLAMGWLPGSPTA